MKGAADVDGGDAGAEDGVGHAAVINAGEDAVPLPGLEPRRRRLIEAVRLEENRPRAVFLVVAGDAAEQAAGVFARCFDEQRDVRDAGHEGRAETSRRALGFSSDGSRYGTEPMRVAGARTYASRRFCCMASARAM